MDIAAYPQHTADRTSGADWLGNVPASWTVKKMKYLFRDHSQKGKPDAELLSVTQNENGGAKVCHGSGGIGLLRAV